jgi:hypothetical protein
MMIAITVFVNSSTANLRPARPGISVVKNACKTANKIKGVARVRKALMPKGWGGESQAMAADWMRDRTEPKVLAVILAPRSSLGLIQPVGWELQRDGSHRCGVKRIALIIPGRGAATGLGVH